MGRDIVPSGQADRIISQEATNGKTGGNSLSRHRAAIRRGAFILLITGLLLFGATLWFPKPLATLFYPFTGEENLVEGIKGMGALALLRLTQPPLQTAAYVPMPYTGVNPYGVNTFLQLEAEEQNIERQLALLRQAGFGWIRQEFPWEDIEIHSKGDFEDRRTRPYKSAWLKYDRIVALAESYGIKILARLDNPPAWSRAQADEIGTLAPPDNFDDYGEFVAAVASRYCGHVNYYQIWNEPNIYPEWGDQPVSPEGYAELLRVAYGRIKTVCPQATVVSAALAQNTEPGGRNMSDLLFLERMYAAGASDHFDILGAQAFGLWTGPTDRRTSPSRTNFSRIELARDIMVRHGDADKPIWITEMGWAAVPPTIPTVYGRVTREQQARYLVDAYRRVAREWPFVGPMFIWFLRRPDWSEADQDWFYFGLIDPDWKTTPAFEALSWLAGQPSVVYPGLQQESHWGLDYQGVWRSMQDSSATLGRYMHGRVGAGLRFAFEGTSLALHTAPGSEPGQVLVTLDGKVRKPLMVQPGDTVSIAQGLPDRRHQVALKIVAGSLNLDYILVRRSYDRLIHNALAGLSLLCILAGAVILARHILTPPA